MGIAGVGDAFSGKYPTMQIFSRDGSWYVIPIRSVSSSSLILVKIKGRIYPFLLDASKMKTYRYKGSKIVQTLLYSLEDAIPVSPENLIRLQQFAKQSGIGKLDANSAMLILRAHEMLLGDETRSVVSLEEIAEDMKARGEDPGTIISDFTASTGILQVVRPMPEVVEYLSDRLMINPSALASGLLELKQMSWEWKKIANPAKTPFQHWMLLIGVVIGISAIAGIGVYGYEQGWFTGGLPAGLDWLDLQEQFPDGPPGAPAASDIVPELPADPGIVIPGLEPLAPILEPLIPDLNPEPAAAPPVPEPAPPVVQEPALTPPPPAPVPEPVPTSAGVPHVSDLPPDVLSLMLAEYLATTTTQYPDFVLPPGTVSNTTVIGCGKGTVLIHGLCVVPAQAPAPNVTGPELPDWHPGVPTDADRIYDSYVEHRDGIAAQNRTNPTPQAPLHGSGFTLDQLEALCYVESDSGDWCTEFYKMRALTALAGGR